VHRYPIGRYREGRGSSPPPRSKLKRGPTSSIVDKEAQRAAWQRPRALFSLFCLQHDQLVPTHCSRACAREGRADPRGVCAGAAGAGRGVHRGKDQGLLYVCTVHGSDMGRIGC
jgi:hypothetical protein